MKKWYQSKTILLQIVAAIVLALRLFGVEVAEGSDQSVVDAILVGAAVVGNIGLRFKTNESVGI